MPSITPNSINEKSLTNINDDDATTWNDHTETWDEATASWEAPGRPITKGSINEKSLTNLAENT